MAFGTVLSDKEGREFARYDRENYHFWGVVSVFPTEGGSRTRLFNIPSGVPIALFCNVEFGPYGNLFDAGGRILHHRDSGYHEVSVQSVWNNLGGTTQFGSSFKKANFYVFVPARYIPSTVFGFVLYAANGTVMFNSSRPVLQVCGVTSGLSENGTDDLTFFNRSCSRPAGNIGGGAWSMLTRVPGGQFYEASFNRFVRVANQYVSAAFSSMFDILVPFKVSSTPPQNVALVDGGYYESFGSLGNFS